MSTTSATGSGKRILRDVLVGACLAGIAFALVWRFYPGSWKEPVPTPDEIAREHRQVLQEEAQRQAVLAAAAAAAQPVAAPGPCELDPLIPPGAARDGRAVVEHPFPGGPRARAKRFQRQAETAAVQGRPRDAEVALLASCREFDAASPGPTVPLARVLGMLGERYVAAAGGENAPVLREQLLARARQVLGLSAAAYATALGPNASRSRQARQRLAALDQEFVAVADAPQPGVEQGQEQAAPKPRAKPAEIVRTAPGPKPQPERRAGPEPSQPPVQVATAEPRPKRADPAADPEIAQLATDLARLRAQAEAVSDDPAGFSRRAGLARAQRDRCEDAGCLREWYGKRRRELLAEF